MHNVVEPSLNFDSIAGYKHNCSTAKRVTSLNRNENVVQTDTSKDFFKAEYFSNIPYVKHSSFSSTGLSADSASKSLLIDENSIADQNTQKNSSNDFLRF